MYHPYIRKTPNKQEPKTPTTQPSSTTTPKTTTSTTSPSNPFTSPQTKTELEITKLKLETLQSLSAKKENQYFRSTSSMDKTIMDLRKSRDILLESEEEYKKRILSLEEKIKKSESEWKDKLQAVEVERDAALNDGFDFKQQSTRMELNHSKQISQLELRIKELERSLSIAENKKPESKVETIEKIIDPNPKLEQQIREQDRQIQKLQLQNSRLLMQNNKYKEINENNLILQEKIFSLTSQLERQESKVEVLKVPVEDRELKGKYSELLSKYQKAVEAGPSSVCLEENATLKERVHNLEEEIRLKEETRLKESNEHEAMRKQFETTLTEFAETEKLISTGKLIETDTRILKFDPNSKSHKPFTNLEKELETANKNLDRLKQVFRQKIKEFREAVYSLLGYKLDLLQSGEIRLLSNFCFNENDFLLFEKDSEVQGQLVLKETEFTFQLQNEIDLYLKKRNSIPAFLCAVTLLLWEKSTLA